MKNVYIVGAGDFGREMEWLLEALPGFGKEFCIKGYLDDDPDALKGKPSDYKIAGAPKDFEFGNNDSALITITNPTIRKQIVNILNGKVNFFTYLAPDASIGKYTNIGEGAIVCPGCYISTNSTIGSFVIINVGSRIGHDCVLESFTSLMANVDLGGHVRLGEGVFAGTKSTVIPGKIVSEGIVIGSGSVVIRNLTKKGTYFGNPAKLMQF